MASPGSKAAAALVRRHPLQRLDSPSRGLSAAVHLLGLASFGSSFKYLVDNPNDINSSYGWHFQYLTIIGLFLATATFAVGLLADVFASHLLFQTKNALSICSAPLEVLISCLYWSLLAIDPKLVLPDFVEATSLPVDMGFHLAPAVLLSVDLLFFSPPWTVGLIPSAALSSSISIGYWLWVEVCYSQNGFYPYPIFDGGVQIRTVLFTGSAVVMAAFTLLLKYMYGLVNGTTAQFNRDHADERSGDVKGQSSKK